MHAVDFDQVKNSLTTLGPARAIDQLCTRLRDSKDYANLFYALLMRKRFELGVSPVPTAPSQELPAETHAPYEDAIRRAVREVGDLFLTEGNIPQAWGYYRMIGEPAPVARAIDAYQPADGEDITPIVAIAFQEGVNPKRGFDLILNRFGICSAITTVSNQEQLPPEAKQHCVERLIQSLYDELRERIRADIERRESTAPAATTSVRELMSGRDYLFEDDFAHIDTSHLSAVVQMALTHPATPASIPYLKLVREMCAYGQRISPKLQYQADPPFQDTYRDYDIYLAAVLGERVEEGIRHFNAKAEQAAADDPDGENTFPAEVLVNLLLRLDRLPEAVGVARQYLVKADPRRLTCPSVVELCQRAHDFQALADVARDQQDPVHFLAGLIAFSHEPQASAVVTET
jgi:hypothetical protein